MSDNLIKEAQKVLAGKSGRLEDEELEYLAQQITKLGFKIGYARAYAAGPSLASKLAKRLERQEKQMDDVRKALGFK
jgi:hypothetical protein